VYQIGPEPFLDIRGVPDLLKARLQLVVRSGVDGTAIWDDGTRGQPFTVRAISDAETIGDAFDKFVRCTQLVDADPIDVRWAGAWLSMLGVLYQVLDVRPVEVCSLANASGGMNWPSLGWCELEFDLLAVPVG
jgi:hypothetical protein